ncbi:MAG TPA: GNAT family N-acetyltransferase [Anaerolineales bacterium]|nr:GNAT family N-acetyltransferase [Anaerolineales bacterium]
MLPEHIKGLREMITLKDGAYVLLRPMVAKDFQRLMEFYAAVGQEDLRYFRDYVKEPGVVQAWCDNLDYSRVLPILALLKERVVGSASLHFNERSKRHVAEIRLFLAKDFRKRGLGMKMSRTLIELARKQGMSILVAEVVSEKTEVVKAFESLGFRQKATLDDYFMLPDGETRDVVLLSLTLSPRTDEF